MKEVVTTSLVEEGSDIIEFFERSGAFYCFEMQWEKQAVKEALASGKVVRINEPNSMFAMFLGMGKLAPADKAEELCRRVNAGENIGDLT